MRDSHTGPPNPGTQAILEGFPLADRVPRHHPGIPSATMAPRIRGLPLVSFAILDAVASRVGVTLVAVVLMASAEVMPPAQVHTIFV